MNFKKQSIPLIYQCLQIVLPIITFPESHKRTLKSKVRKTKCQKIVPVSTSNLDIPSPLIIFT